MYHGDIRLGDTIDLKLCTVGTTGAPTTLAASPVIAAYPGNSTTQITAGITLTVDFDGVTGLHNIRVVATSGNGYATATNYTLVITTGTVGGTSVVGYCVGSFSIENRSAVMPTTAACTLDVSSAGEAGVDWANVGSPTTTVGLTNTTVGTLTTYTGNTVQSGDAYARIGAAGVSLSAIPDEAGVTTLLSRLSAARAGYLDNVNNAALQTTVAQTGDSYARLGATGSGLTTLATAAALATVQADTDDLQTRLPAALTAGGNMKADALLLNGATPNNLAATAVVSAGAITTSGGKVSGVLLTDTVTTYTGNTPQTGDVYPLASTEIADIKAKTDLIPASPAAVGSAMTLTSGERTSIADATRARQLTEGYAADGVAPTLEQAVFLILQGLLEFGIAGTVLTVKKLDKATTAATYTLDDATAPTSRTRAT